MNCHSAVANISTLAPHLRARSGLVRTWQSVELFSDLTVGENLAVTLDRAAASDVLRDLFRPYRRSDADEVAAVLGLLGLADRADRSPGDLSLGEQKLVGVARSLASAPELIMLDEPAAGLDSTESKHFGDRLLDVADSGVAVILIDHDMGLVLEVCDYIYVLDFGRLIAEGTADDIRRDPVVITAYLGAEVTVLARFSSRNSSPGHRGVPAVRGLGPARRTRRDRRAARTERCRENPPLC